MPTIKKRVCLQTLPLDKLAFPRKTSHFSTDGKCYCILWRCRRGGLNSICWSKTRDFLWSLTVDKWFQTVGTSKDAMNGWSRKWRHKATNTPKFHKFERGLDKWAVEIFRGLSNNQATRGSGHPLSCKVIDWRDHWGQYHVFKVPAFP